MDIRYRNSFGTIEGKCDITDFLDENSGLNKNKDSFIKHYLYISNFFISDNNIPIRIPGGTVGDIEFDGNGIITGISVDTNYVVKTYSKDINDQLKKFIGKNINIEKLKEYLEE